MTIRSLSDESENLTAICSVVEAYVCKYRHMVGHSCCLIAFVSCDCRARAMKALDEKLAKLAHAKDDTTPLADATASSSTT